MKNRKKNNIKELLVSKPYWKWSVALQFIRIPMLMTSISFLFMSMEINGDYSIGGYMITAYVLGMTVLTIPCGKILDGIGLSKGIPILLSISSLSLLGIYIAFIFQSEPSWFILFAGLSGGSISGIPGAMRTLLSTTIKKDMIPGAIALDATIIEIIVVLAPIIAALTSVFWGYGSIFSMIFFNLIAWLLVKNLTIKLKEKSEHTVIDKTNRNCKKHWYLNRSFIFWTFLSTSFGIILGSVEVGALPLGNELHTKSTTALLLITILAICSAISGIGYALINHKVNLSYQQQACILVLFMTINCYYLASASNFSHAVLAVSFIGCTVAPLMTVRSMAVEDLIPSHAKTQGFSIINTAHTIGFSISGVLIAELPLYWIFIVSVISGVSILLIAPFLLWDLKSLKWFYK